jgi:protein-S-isoprenylcysteine O-methyltransferase Ste14
VDRKTRLDRLLDLSVALVWAVFAVAMLDKILRGGDLFDLGRMVFYTLLSYLFLRRWPASRKGTWWQNMLAWGATVFSMIALSSAPGRWRVLGLTIQGFALLAMILALASLGRSFGVGPADRGLVKRGPYRWVRHPLYAAELWFVAGWLVANTSWRNLAALVILSAVSVVRALWEERIISGYTDYARQVRWRLLPLVW